MDKYDVSSSDRKRLHALGYKLEDFAEMSIEGAAQIILEKRHKPGSRAAVAAVAAATGHPGVPDRYTDEGVAEYNQGKEPASGYVIRSDHEGDLLSRAALRKLGSGVPLPTDEIAQPYVDANPDRAFRWLTKEQCAKRGTRGWQPVYDKTGKKVTHLNEGRYLAHKPKDVRDAQLREYQEAGERAQQAAHDAMDSTIDRLGKDNSQTGSIRALNADHPIFNR